MKFSNTIRLYKLLAVCVALSLLGAADTANAANAHDSVSGKASDSASITASHGTTSTDDDLSKRLNSVIDNAIATKKIVGTVVIVAKDGKIVYRQAAGYADRENKIKTEPDTIFRLASMSKTIVSTAALALIQSGKLRLDDPVTKFLPDFKPKLADGTTPLITVRELLTHTAGLDYKFSEPEDGPYHKANVSDGIDQPGLSMQENLRRIASCPLLYYPGTKWHYSLAIDVLGAVLEKAAGKSLNEIVKETVTTPLGMKDTAFTVADKKRLAVPYVDGSPEPTKMREGENIKSKGTDLHFAPSRILDEASFPSGGAGLAGTADDYVKLLEAIRTNDKTLLNQQMMTFLKLNQIGDLKAKESPGWGFGYGSGVMFEAQPKYPYSVGTLEWGGVYGCHWFMDPSKGLTVVELTNTTLEGLFGNYPKNIVNAVYNVSKTE